MHVTHVERSGVTEIAAAIGERARARILYCLVDGHPRTSTELSLVAEVSPSTTSAHLERLKGANLVRVAVQGKHRLYRLAGPDVARALEGLSVLAGSEPGKSGSKVPPRLRMARTCYDHMAGLVGVTLHDRFRALKWIRSGNRRNKMYALSADGTKGFESLGIEIDALRGQRRRFACPCMDWSERRPHLAGALGAALLQVALKRKWVIQDLDSRALDLTTTGRREMMSCFGVRV